MNVNEILKMRPKKIADKPVSQPLAKQILNLSDGTFSVEIIVQVLCKSQQDTMGAKQKAVMDAIASLIDEGVISLGH